MRSEAASRINRYLLGEVIGAGGMGTVLRATDQVLGRNVAVKLLREELTGNAAALARFRQEARIAASLSHPGIAAIYDFLEEGEQQALVMELLDGQDLHAMLERGGPLVPDVAARIGADVADALAYAHGLGAVHRDIKPANIFLTRSGTVKLTDFGVAYAAGAGQVTTTGMLIGTPDYLSPEQVRGERATPASDLYSLGCVVFQLVTGRTPFGGDHPVAVATARLGAEAPSARLLNPSVSETLDSVIRCAMAPAPADRFVSAAAMAQALRTAVRSDPGATRAMPLVLGVPGGQESSRLFTGPATMVEAPLPPVALRPEPVTPHVIRPAPGEPPRSRHAWRGLGVALAALLLVGVTLAIVAAWRVSDAPKVIPSWSGQSVDSVSADARRMGFVVQRSDVSSQVAVGTVLASTPAPGATLKRGGTVSLQVSLGNLLALPDVKSKTLDIARTILKGNGLNPIIASQTLPGTVDGLVASQIPAAGTVVAKGSTVTLVGSKVPPPPPPSPTPSPSSGFLGQFLDPFKSLFGLGGGSSPSPNATPARGRHQQGANG